MRNLNAHKSRGALYAAFHNEKRELRPGAQDQLQAVVSSMIVEYPAVLVVKGPAYCFRVEADDRARLTQGPDVKERRQRDLAGAQRREAHRLEHLPYDRRRRQSGDGDVLVADGVGEKCRSPSPIFREYVPGRQIAEKPGLTPDLPPRVDRAQETDNLLFDGEHEPEIRLLVEPPVIEQTAPGRRRNRVRYEPLMEKPAQLLYVGRARRTDLRG